MKKQTKVLAAATLLTLGATFSSFAGEVVESDWCLDGTTEYWINDDGYLGANEWVSDDEHAYYVKADGSKAMNEWQYIYGEDDEDAEEESWFWFDAKGRARGIEKKEENGEKFKVEGVEYCFDATGKMLTGWVDTATFTEADSTTDPAKVVFCNEDGSIAKKAWINQFPWNATEAEKEDFYEGEHEVWYYASSNGKLTFKKANDYTGTTYFFNKTTGEMLTGWVAVDADGYCVDAEDIDSISEWNAAGLDVYFADEDYGHAKKNGWRELENVAGDEYWFHFDKLGKVFMATGSNANIAVETYKFEDGEINAVVVDADGFAGNAEAKKISGVKYLFNNAGEMIEGLVKVDTELKYLYDGAAFTGKVELTDENENDYTFYFAEKTKDGQKKEVAAEGNYNGYCYSDGQLMTSDESGEYREVITDAGKFLVDYRGKIQKNTNKNYDGFGYIVLAENQEDNAEYSISGFTSAN